MVRLELDQVVMRRMREDDIEAVKALIKVRIIQNVLLSSTLVSQTSTLVSLGGL